MQLSQKPKTFSLCFFTFSKFRFNFEHFQKKKKKKKKKDPPSSCIFELTDSKKRGQINVSELPFQRTLPQVTC